LSSGTDRDARAFAAQAAPGAWDGDRKGPQTFLARACTGLFLVRWPTV
jgi:hypothetical protein